MPVNGQWQHLQRMPYILQTVSTGQSKTYISNPVPSIEKLNWFNLSSSLLHYIIHIYLSSILTNIDIGQHRHTHVEVTDLVSHTSCHSLGWCSSGPSGHWAPPQPGNRRSRRRWARQAATAGCCWWKETCPPSTSTIHWSSSAPPMASPRPCTRGRTEEERYRDHGQRGQGGMIQFKSQWTVLNIKGKIHKLIAFTPGNLLK